MATESTEEHGKIKSKNINYSVNHRSTEFSGKRTLIIDLYLDVLFFRVLPWIPWLFNKKNWHPV
jgi:hypothetical protein